MNITIYGASDDLVEVAVGDKSDEFNSDDWTAVLIDKTGARMRIYCRYERSGCWSVGVGQVDEEFQLPGWPVTITQAPANESGQPRLQRPAHHRRARRHRTRRSLTETARRPDEPGNHPRGRATSISAASATEHGCWRYRRCGSRTRPPGRPWRSRARKARCPATVHSPGGASALRQSPRRMRPRSETAVQAMANEREGVAQPGDPDLDLHLIGLRIAELVVLPNDEMTDLVLTLDTRESAGFWTDSSTGERFYPDTVTSCAITAGLRMEPGYEYLLDMMIARLEAWKADKELITVTGAPGRWTLLYCPGHPAGQTVPIPRTGAPRTEPREGQNHA